MSIAINTNYDVRVPAPFDARTQVQAYGDLAFIAVIFIGLKVFVVDDNAEYRYYSTGWQLWSSQGGGGGSVSSAWGSITGDINAQVDLGLEFNKKYDKTGGIITGAVTVQSYVDAYNFILAGSENSQILNTLVVVDVPSTPTSTGVVNEVAFDATHFYICIATNTWVRAALSTWTP